MTAGTGSGGFEHCALFYASQAQYLGEVLAFVRAGLARGDPVLITVPPARAGPLREALGRDWQRITYTDITRSGGNPGRLIPAIHGFLDSHPGRPVTCVGEPAWPTRSAAEFVETARHEALSNLAFAAVPMRALCPYDVTGLPAGVLAAAEETHPLLARPGGAQACPAYLGPEGMPPRCREPLPDPPPGTQVLRYHSDLRAVRALVGQWAVVAGLSLDRSADLVLAVSELTANTLAHTPGGGTLRVWQVPGSLVCEVRDGGWIADPLADRPPPDPAGPMGHGLWVVNQVCDLVQLRSGPQGTVARLHMYLDGR